MNKLFSSGYKSGGKEQRMTAESQTRKIKLVI